jgi:hypothetical protein
MKNIYFEIKKNLFNLFSESDPVNNLLKNIYEHLKEPFQKKNR